MFKHNEVAKKRSWLRIVLMIVPVVLVFLGASYYAVNQWYQDNLQPVSEVQTADVVVVVESGSSVREIGDQLKDLGVIRNSTVFSWYVGRQESRGELQAGTYKFNSGQSVEEIVERLVTGDVATNLFTILPGKRLDELEEDLLAFGLPPDEVTSAINNRYDHPLFANTPSNATLEGYIFPDTYELTIDGDVSDLLVRSFDEFEALLTPELLAGIEKQGLTLHEAIILASIVHEESANVDDQVTIAQVFHKRLNSDIPLGSDPTFIYVAAITGEEATPDLDNPYNTRIYGGLPPGPISNFNLSALEAVANPSDTDFLYFVAGDDGTTHFTRTLAEHEAAIAKYCFEACKLPSQQ